MESSNVAEPIFLSPDVVKQMQGKLFEIPVNIINKGITVLILRRPFGEVTKASKILFASIKSNYLL